MTYKSYRPTFEMVTQSAPCFEKIVGRVYWNKKSWKFTFIH